MTRTTHRNRILSTAAAFTVAMCGAGIAGAVPITGTYIEDSRCDNIPGQTLSHELGDVSTFPINEQLQFTITKSLVTVCAAPDGIANDWDIRMTNVAVPAQAWQNVFFVANYDITVGNADGTVVDPGNAAILSDSFRIDAAGTNNSLVENGVVDGIFSPGETWSFNVSNFQHIPSGVSPTPGFFSPGQFAGTTSVTTIDTASILATAVPEPAAAGMMGIAAGATLLRRRRR